MRMMLTATLDTEAANRAVKDGSMMKIFQRLQSRTKPEATYYTTIGGKRTVLLFFDCKDPSSILVELAEPLFLGVNADIRLEPVMNDADLKRGFAAWKRAEHSLAS